MKAAAIICAIMLMFNSYMCLPADASDIESVQSITQRILLKSIELNRFIIHYRLETQRQPKTRRLRYAATQEGGLALLMTYDIMTTEQFGKGAETH